MLSAKQIMPGKKGIVIVKVDTHGLGGMSIEKEVMIRTNDPRGREVRLTITALVTKEYEISARYIVFGEIAKGTTVTKEVIISMSASMDLINAEASNPAIKIAVRFIGSAAGKRYHLVVDYTAPKYKHYLAGRILIHTNSKLTPEIVIAVQAYIM